MTAADRLKLAETERAIERRMIGVQQTDHVRNEQLRAMTRVDDAVDLANKAKKRWAGHLMRRTDERWTKDGRAKSPSGCRSTSSGHVDALQHDGATRYDKIWDTIG